MKKKLHKRKRLKSYSQITKEQSELIKVKEDAVQEFSIIAYVPESNSEIMVTSFDDESWDIRMFREAGRDVFVHCVHITKHGMFGLQAAVNRAIRERYEHQKTKANEE